MCFCLSALLWDMLLSEHSDKDASKLTSPSEKLHQPSHSWQQLDLYEGEELPISRPRRQQLKAIKSAKCTLLLCKGFCCPDQWIK